MSNRLTLEGDQTIPEDFQITRVYGKFLPKVELSGELSGDFFVERIDGYSPQIAQLSGMDEAKHSQAFGTFIHDDAIPLSLSGDELGMWGALLRGFRFRAPAMRMPALRGFKVNTRSLSRGISNSTKSIGKVGKEFGRGAKNVVKAHQQALKSVGKGLGKIAEGGMDLLQSMGQGQGEQGEGEESEEGQTEQGPSDETQFNSEDPGYSEEQTDEGTEMEEVNGELGFLPQAMMAAGTAGQIFSNFNSMQEKKAQAKHARSMEKMNSFSSILRPQTKTASKPKPATKKAFSSNSTFSNPSVSQNAEGGFKLSYSNRGADADTGSTGSGEKKDDNKNVMYIGGAVVVVLAIAFIMNKKGK
ncbi:hypothetical protein [Leptospira kmetyi]|uniref:hypothetical protein n=1 Tax=Leptospira kmetyi TaxID=408139 RepID=UPI003EBE7F69